MKSMLDAWLTDLKDGLKGTTASLDVTETEPNAGTMQSVEEYQEIPKGEASGMPVGGPRKRHRVQTAAVPPEEEGKDLGK
jgi:hypothetical protein